MCERLQIPQKGKIAELPVLGMVAFATRCARRVQPLFAASWTDAPEKHIQAIEDAITLAEKTAESAQRSSQKGTDAVLKADAAAQDATVAGYVTAAYAALAAKYALQGPTAFPIIASNYIAEKTSIATDAADKAAKKATSTDSAYNVFITAVWSDFNTLKAKAKKGKPIPHDLLADLWPEGKPLSWPT